MKGIISNIQRMSINDGPGIRTTIFFKGCNMRCIWCHNPETFKLAPELQWIEENCTGCFKCVENCPANALLENNSKPDFDFEKCSLCENCFYSCPQNAIEIVGRYYSVEEILDIISEDEIFYKTSGGGITVSGGEAMMQISFLEDLMKKIKNADYHLAIETNASSDWQSFEKIIPFTDLFLVDLKLFDSVKHKTFTGIGNERILENIKQLNKFDKPIILRTPVIPTITDEEDIKNIAALAASLKNVIEYELLKFHPLGNSKYNSLGLKNKLENVKELSEEEMIFYKRLAHSTGAPVKGDL